ncbi:3-oxoacyl-[acyl-carrier-protein] synthase 3 [Algimonas ampicilliniresistens]|uniref:Beta-ketoacyl-[acyl-carrier-protein] synthase III n=1 Tax=Algimonas ampicilliniresistens TaxID=1298735 RepID=A0ABQ5V9F1_9PROT|nr:beta-ketoacyl-ACP synthase III [Algimonas ampicilliniresistens]GLQ23285.1 3-oxoacyl-[acyl-carrier-protein] synthase 3 [Algimonas ampicilliniresistens]
MTVRAVVRGIGSYLPERVMENAEFAETLGLETSDEWIRERTGIKRRHIAAEGETTSDLGLAAALKALESANMTAADLDLILVATSTPDLTFPSTATMIQHRLGMTHGAAFDVQAVCSGFVYGIHTANALIRSGAHQRILLIGAETFSRILDWEDRGTCVLFGDGAGAIILEAQSDTQDGVIHSVIRSNGAHCDMLYVDGGPSSTGTVGKLRMLGNAVFKHAVNDIARIIQTCADEAEYDVPTIDWFVPHQANQRILTAVARKLKLRPEQVVSTVAEHANTSAASVPLAWDAAVRDGRIKKGDTVMLEAFGGGFTWGACLLRY